MNGKAFTFILLLLLQLFADAGFHINKGVGAKNGRNSSLSSSTARPSGVYHYSKRSSSTDHQSTDRATQRNLNTISFLLAMAGLLSLAAVIVLWLTSLAGVIAAGALVLIFGMAALGTGYIEAYNKHQNTLGGIGFITGMIEALPVILIGGLFVSIYEIGRFVFRRKRKDKQAN
jgi:hypothetical protein